MHRTKSPKRNDIKSPKALGNKISALGILEEVRVSRNQTLMEVNSRNEASKGVRQKNSTPFQGILQKVSGKTDAMLVSNEFEASKSDGSPRAKKKRDQESRDEDDDENESESKGNLMEPGSKQSKDRDNESLAVGPTRTELIDK